MAAAVRDVLASTAPLVVVAMLGAAAGYLAGWLAPGPFVLRFVASFSVGVALGFVVRSVAQAGHRS
jgi:hypothetical protein